MFTIVAIGNVYVIKWYAYIKYKYCIQGFQSLWLGLTDKCIYANMKDEIEIYFSDRFQKLSLNAFLFNEIFGFSMVLVKYTTQ